MEISRHWLVKVGAAYTKTNFGNMINSQLDFRLEEVLPKFKKPMQEKIMHSINLLRKAEKLALVYDPENGFYNTFSGGKDSQCLYHIVKLAGVRHKTHMNLTSVDPPEVIRFVRTQYPDVELIKPKDSIFNLAVKMKILPTMRVRWCCAEYKETAGAGKVTLIGIRHAESTRRAKRNEVEINNRKFSGNLDELEEYRKENNHIRRGRKPKGYKEVTIVNADGERVLGCIRGKESLLISPIINWSDDDVWTFLNALDIAHCELYDQGFHRIGCICCPMSPAKQKRRDIERYPHVKRGWIKAIKAIRDGGGIQRRIYLVEHQKGLDPSRKCQRIAQDGQGGTNGGLTPTGSSSTAKPCEQKTPLPPPAQPTDKSRIVGNAEPEDGFSESSSSDRLTEEQENEIAENIFDWWISGKSYKKWYADKFSPKLDFGD